MLGRVGRQRYSLRLRFYILLLTGFLIPFQNCGDVHVSPKDVAELPSTNLTVDSLSYLKIETDSTKSFRMAFLVDMSNSMFAGACPDTLDTLVDINPEIKPSANCLSPSGVDPDGKRFQVMLQWLHDMQDRIAQSSGKLTEAQFKVLIVPFSMTPIPDSNYGNRKDFWSLDNYLMKKLIGNAGIVLAVDNPASSNPFVRHFVSLSDAIKISYLLWAMDNRFHAHPYDSKIPTEIVRLAEGAPLPTGNVYPSSGVSQPAPAMEIMTNQLSAELMDLKTRNAIASSHFELVFLSDGVPKPHPLHIEAMVKMIWAVKKDVCDAPAQQPGTCLENSNNDKGWKKVRGGRNCAAVCKNYLQQFVDTGSVQLAGADKPNCLKANIYAGPYGGYYDGCEKYSDGATEATRWGKDIKCGQCMELLNQFDYTYSAGQSRGQRDLRYNQNQLREKASAVWGDWTLNRHPYIIQKLKTMQNMFNIQFPGSQWRFNFVRVDSDIRENKIQAGELLKELNWIVKAQDYYKKSQRFTQITTAKIPFDLFYEISRDQEYKLGVIYAYNRTYHLDPRGTLAVDAKNKRSDGVCLDSMKARYSDCIRPPACDPKIDADGDGLNQCEEATLGTNDMDPDSDGDGIIDGAEILFGFNPMTDDRNLISPLDHQNNFDHFVKGAPSLVNLQLIPKEKLIDLSTQLFDYKGMTTSNGSTYRSPGYHIVLKNIPIKPGMDNEIVVIARADNLSSPNDSRWLAKVYKVNSLSTTLEVNVEDLKELAKLKLGTP